MALRTASRLFPGSHVPWLGIGTEYMRTSHLPLALQNLLQAELVAPDDPLVLHELGVVHYISGEYTPAIHCFGKVAKRGRDTLDDEAREPSIFNLGHAYRKLRLYEQAAEAYEAALAIRPRSASTFAARFLCGRLTSSTRTHSAPSSR